MRDLSAVLAHLSKGRLCKVIVYYRPLVFSVAMTQLTDPRRKQILYRAQHRGFKEADLVIGGFAAAHLPTLDEALLDEFEALLQIDDHDLYNWIIGKKEVPENIQGPVFSMLQKFDVAAITAP